MSALLYIPPVGLTLNQKRRPVWKTSVPEALSGKQSAVVLRQFPLIKFEHEYDILRDNVSPSELKALAGLHNQLKGRGDTFLYSDPEFNSVSLWQFATGDGSTVLFPVTATYENPGGPGGPELIQNFNGTPLFYIDRWGVNELLSPGPHSNLFLQSQALANVAWTQTNVTSTNNASVAPDGTTTATKILETTANALHWVGQAVAVSSAVDVLDVEYWVNPNLTRTWCWLEMTEATGSTAVVAWFNLTGAGAVGTITAGANWSTATAGIDLANNGFYRVWLRATKTNAATSVSGYVGPATGNGVQSYAGVATDGITAWGAQLESPGGPGIYLPTTTATATQTDIVLGPSVSPNVVAGYLLFNFTPPGGSELLWTGSFYYRCRFDDDSIDWTKFMNQWWMLKKLGFTSVML